MVSGNDRAQSNGIVWEKRWGGEILEKTGLKPMGLLKEKREGQWNYIMAGRDSNKWVPTKIEILLPYSFLHKGVQNTKFLIIVCKRLNFCLRILINKIANILWNNTCLTVTWYLKVQLKFKSSSNLIIWLILISFRRKLKIKKIKAYVFVNGFLMEGFFF